MAEFVSIASWISWFALTWMLIILPYPKGTGMSPMVGWFMFLFVALVSSLFNSSTKGGDKNES